MRTEAQAQAFQRDFERLGGHYCLWCFFHEFLMVDGTDVHHIAGRKPGADVPELCITLCHDHHLNGVHGGREPTKAQLVDLMREVYGHDLRSMFPEYCG